MNHENIKDNLSAHPDTSSVIMRNESPDKYDFNKTANNWETRQQTTQSTLGSTGQQALGIGIYKSQFTVECSPKTPHKLNESLTPPNFELTDHVHKTPTRIGIADDLSSFMDQNGSNMDFSQTQYMQRDRYEKARHHTTLIGSSTKKVPDNLMCGEFDLTKENLGRMLYQTPHLNTKKGN